MKKLIFLATISFLTISMTGCFTKALTTKDFQEHMETLGYVVETGHDAGENNSEIEELMIARKDQIEIKFYVLSNSGTAIDFSENLKKEWANSNNYTDINRKDHTLIVVNVDPAYQTSVQKDIKTLGY